MGNTAEKEEIIIRCSAQEMVKNFVKDYQIVWHDPSIHSPENSQYIAQFNSFCEVKPFPDWKSAAEYTNTADTSCHLITSGTNGELLVKEIHAAKNVSKIYVFCGNKAFHQTWASQYPKIICVENDIKKLMVQIELNMLEWQRQTSSLRVGLPAFAPIFDDMDKSEMNYLHLNLKGLSNFKNRAQAKEDFLSLSKVIFPDKVNITEFQNSYNKYDMKQILKWYTKESFLYKVTNNCLRIATSDAIQYCRLILKDLETAIRQQYQVKSKVFSGLLYRGAYISEREWTNLVANIGKDIEMYGFLSTSKNKVRAEEFVMTDFDRKVLITIIVPQGPDKGEQGFAEVHEFSHFPLEQEVLFNVRSRFTILEADMETIAERPVRHLVLFYGAQEWRKNNLLMKPVLKIRLNPLKQQNITCQACKEKVIGGAYFISLVADMKGYTCHKCLVEGYITINKGPFLYINTTATGTGESTIEENGQKVLVVKGSVMKYPKELDIPMYGYQCNCCKGTKQTWYYKCVECKKTLWCEKCFKGGEDCAESGHNIMLEGRPFSFWCEEMTEQEYQHISFQEGMIEKDGAFEQADIFFKSNQYEKAIQYYNKVIENASKDEKKKENLAMTYGNLGLVYSNLGRYEEALENLFKSLEITRKASKKKNPDMALCYNNIGLVYDSMKNHEEGLKFYFMSLELYKEIYGENSQDVAMLYNNIGLVYDGLEKYEEALEYHNKSIEIKIELYGENDVTVATSYNNIGLAYDNMGKEEEALENYFKALEIKKAVYGEKHADIAMLYNNIGLVYKGMKKYNKALSHSLKSLEIKRLIYGENHPDTALAYNNIGLVYEGQGKYEEGLKNFVKSLEISRGSLGENHQDVAKAYQMIGRMLRELGKYEESLDNLRKSLEIKKSLFGEKDASVIQMKKNIEQVNAKLVQSLQKFKKKNKINANKGLGTSTGESEDSSPAKKDFSPTKKDKESFSPISDKNNEKSSP